MSKHYKILSSMECLEYICYYCDEELSAGTLVDITIKTKRYLGVVAHSCEEEHKFPLKKCLPLPYRLPITFLNFLEKFSLFNFVSCSRILKSIGTILPKRLPNMKFETMTYTIPSLSLQQEEARKEIVGATKPVLLYGITGSGKTSIFFSLIGPILERGGKVLVLLPEIALLNSILKRFQQVFGDRVLLWHSKSKQKKIFHQLLQEEPLVLLGTRSALLIPISDLQLIILDEEHDRSYKQGNFPYYHARDMAVWRANLAQIPMILSSATPSLESKYNVDNNKYTMVCLRQRYGEAQLPKFTLLRESEIIPSYVLERIKQELDKNHQIVIFLNRRGLATLLICAQCGERQICTCGSLLVKHNTHITCHSCNRKFYEEKCMVCNSFSTLQYFGYGVEKITLILQKHFPMVNISSFSSDSSMQILEDFSNGKISILVSTQIFSKGHNLLNISLVFVVQYFQTAFDFRLSEYLFQNLYQIAGRTGRGKIPGEVILNSITKNAFLDMLMEYDYTKFLEKEMLERKKWLLPPFTKMMRVFGTKEIPKLPGIYRTYKLPDCTVLSIKREDFYINLPTYRKLLKKYQVDPDSYDFY